MKKTIAYLVLLFCVGLAFSCKKDDGTVNTPSLDGLDILETPVPYVAPGTTVAFKADVEDIYTSDDSTPKGAIGLYWVVSKDSNTVLRDTTSRDIKASNPVFTYTPLDPGSITVTCHAYASGYNSASVSVSFAAIDPDNSLTGLEGTTAMIDGDKYFVADIDGTTWLTSNLYNTQSGISFYLSSVTDKLLGRFYTWEEALSACPQGWTLPTAEQWDALGTSASDLMVNATMLEKKMWTYWPGIDITNAKKFNAIPAGYVDRSGGDSNVQGFMDYAIFWTATEADDPSLAQYRYIYSDTDAVQKGNGSKTSLALSVRCVKE